MNYLQEGNEVRTSNGSLSGLLTLEKTEVKARTFNFEDCR